MGYSPWGHKESDTTERLHFLTHNIKVTTVTILNCGPGEDS